MARKKRSPSPTAAPLSAPAPVNIDIWLQRLSHISQLGLFIFTVGAIYFTVIPLYQNALLDEQIARKEIELRELQSALNSAYAKNRASIVGSFIFHAGPACSGLLIPPRSLRKLGEKAPTNEKNLAQQILEIKPKDCLAKELSSMKLLNELRTQDLALFKYMVFAAGETLEKSRQVALTRYAKAEETSRTKPLAMPNTETAGELANYLLSGQSPEFQKSVLAKVAIDREQMNAADQYVNDVRSKLLELNKIQWPKS